MIPDFPLPEALRSLGSPLAASGLLPWCVVQTQNIPNLDVFKTLVERKRAFTR
jgi:hypothetical protein